MTLQLHTEDPLVYQFYPVTSNSITFSIKAPHDAHIALTSTPYESNPMYEVFFGGWKNTKSVIRKNQQQPDVVEVQTPNILNVNSFRKFWIRLEYGLIMAGVENSNQPLMTWRDSEFFPIRYFGVCTGSGAKGHWIIERNYVPPSNSNAIGYGLFNPQAFPTNAPKWIPSSNGSIPPNAVIGGNASHYEKEELLINSVRANECLYKPQNNQYKNFKLKEDIWENIAGECGYDSVNEAKSKWRNLKDTFRNIRKRNEKMQRSGAKARKVKVWKYYDQMLFLSDIVDHGETKSTNIPMADTSTSTTPLFIISDDENDKNESDDENDNENDCSSKSKRTRKYSAVDVDMEIVKMLKSCSKKIENIKNDPVKLFFLNCKPKQLKVKRALNELIRTVNRRKLRTVNRRK